MNISVCTDALLNKISTADAIKLLSKIGVKAFEFWSWWDKDIDTIGEAAEKYRLIPAAMCTKFVSLTAPEKRNEYIEGLDESIECAKKLGIKILISQTGDDIGTKRELQHESLTEGLKKAVPILEKAGITLAVEPLNTYIDHKGYYLYSSKEGFDIVDEVDSKNVKILYDIYHMQIMEGNIINTISKNIDKIAHFHAAGLPGRGELDIGEINYRAIFDAIDNTNYDAYVGFEYFPKNDAVSGIERFLK